MTAKNEILNNFENHIFYHGTSLEAAESILIEGFRTYFYSPGTGYYATGSNLGNGVYITCNWRMALWFAPTLLRVKIQPGTRILNASIYPDYKMIDYLRREFGSNILNEAPWKAMPKNKKLKLSELIALFRYHYHYTWEKEYGSDEYGMSKITTKYIKHRKLLKFFKNLLVRYGFDGFGNPLDDNGIVIFDDKRIKLKELVAYILVNEDLNQFQSLDDVRKYFRINGSSSAKELAEKITLKAITDEAR